MECLAKIKGVLFSQTQLFLLTKTQVQKASERRQCGFVFDKFS